MNALSKKGKMSVAEAGQKGGKKTAEQHGPKFYHEIGTKGGHRVRDLIRKAKEIEEKSRSKKSSKR